MELVNRILKLNYQDLFDLSGLFSELADSNSADDSLEIVKTITEIIYLVGKAKRKVKVGIANERVINEG